MSTSKSTKKAPAPQAPSAAPEPQTVPTLGSLAWGFEESIGQAEGLHDLATLLQDVTLNHDAADLPVREEALAGVLETRSKLLVEWAQEVAKRHPATGANVLQFRPAE
jgi:hypothetical protein